MRGGAAERSSILLLNRNSVLIGALLITVVSFGMGYFFGFRGSGSPEQDKRPVESAKASYVLSPEEKRVLDPTVKDIAGKPAAAAQSEPANQPGQAAETSAPKETEAPETQAKAEVPKSLDATEKNKKPKPQKNEVGTAAVVSKQLQDQASLQSDQAARSVNAAPKSGRPAGGKAKKKPKYAGHSGKLYAVQVGAFPSKEGAEQLYQNLKAKKYNVYIVDAKGSGDYFKVRVGSFKDRKTAEKSAAALSKKTGLQNFVTATQ